MTARPDLAATWRLRNRTLHFGRVPLLMGIVNVTPDSFSDGGNFFDPPAAIDRALELLDQGATIVDVGGESTRPQSRPVPADEQLRRVVPVIQSITEQAGAIVSIDTSDARVAAEALAAGAEIINDITGLEGDPAMVPLAVESGAGLCAMHKKGDPATMQQNPTYDDVVAEVAQYLLARRDAIVAAGAMPDRICLDPGIGFGKTTGHNLQLLRHANVLLATGCPILIGHSRKRFLGELLGDMDADRSAATLGIAVALARKGIQMLRLHDVRPVCEALLAAEAMGLFDEIA